MPTPQVDAEPSIARAYASRARSGLCRPTRRQRALERLIGCGPGLTPSGDDLVTGFLAGLFSTTGDDRARRAFLEAFCLSVAAAAAATADISRAYLTHAADGCFAEPLVTLARQIGAGADRGAIESATTAALRVGHTSGRAGVFGLLLGLAVWAPHLFGRTCAAQATSSPGLTWSSPGRAIRSPARSPVLEPAPLEPDRIGADLAMQRSRSRDHRPGHDHGCRRLTS